MTQEGAALHKQKHGRRMLIGLLVFFALPVLLVLALYQSGWRPGGASHGQLLTPPQPLHLPGLRDLGGRPFPATQWQGKWSLLYAVGSEGCSSACQQQVYLLRQIHASLNQDIERAQRVLLLPAQADQHGLAALQGRYRDQIVLLSAQAFDLQAGDIFLVDPLGNLIMRYAPGYDPKGLRADLMRLMKYSWVG